MLTPGAAALLHTVLRWCVHHVKKCFLFCRIYLWFVADFDSMQRNTSILVFIFSYFDVDIVWLCISMLLFFYVEKTECFFLVVQFKFWAKFFLKILVLMLQTLLKICILAPMNLCVCVHVSVASVSVSVLFQRLSRDSTFWTHTSSLHRFMLYT